MAQQRAANGNEREEAELAIENYAFSHGLDTRNATLQQIVPEIQQATRSC